MNRELIELLFVQGAADSAWPLLEPPADPDASIRVHTARDLEQALARAAESAIHAVLLCLPAANDARIRLLEQARAGLDALPILALCETTEPAERKALRHAGAAEVFSAAELSARLFWRAVLYVIERDHAQNLNKELELLLEAAPDAILLVNLTGVVRYVNQAAVSLFKRSRAELLDERLGFSVKNGEPSEVTIHAGGEEHLCEMRVVEIVWRRERTLLAALRDITAQRKLEAQLMMSDRMASIGTLAAGVAHEINNPLAAVVGNLDLALQDVSEFGGTGLPPELGAELKDAREAAERVRMIVRDLKTFSRPEEAAQGAVDVHRVIESALRLAQNETRHRARVLTELNPVPLVVANSSRLGQVLLNLIVNAAQAIPEGNAERNEIRITTRVNEQGSVEIGVADTGCGMSLSVQRALFTPFLTTKPVGVGTGLGLALSQRIVTAFGGRIWFESKVGEGSRFFISLPAADANSALAPVSLRFSSRPPTRRARVLVIDDEPAIVELIRRILEHQHDVSGTTSAAEALTWHEQGQRFDVILCDVMMPQVTGMEFFERLQGLDAEQARRIVFLTGGVFTTAARTFLDSIGNRLLEKPFEVRRLLAVVNHLV